MGQRAVLLATTRALRVVVRMPSDIEVGLGLAGIVPPLSVINARGGCLGETAAAAAAGKEVERERGMGR